MINLGRFRKKVDAPTPTPTPAPRADGVSLASFWATAFVGVALLSALGFALVTGAGLQSLRVAALEQMGLRSDAMVRSLSQTLDTYREELLGVARDPELLQVLGSGDRELISGREKQLTALLPGAFSVRLLEPGQDTLDVKADSSLGFSSVVLLKAAERAETPPPFELYRTQQGKVYLGGAAALRDVDGKTLGVVLIAFETGFVTKALERNWPEGARVELRQRVRGEAITLFTNPGAPAVSGAPDTSRVLEASQLEVAHWFRPPLWMPDTLPSFATAVGAAVVLLSGLLMGIQYRRLRSALQGDQALIAQELDDVLQGRRPKGAGLAVKGLGGSLDFIRQRLGQARPQPPVPETAKVNRPETAVPLPQFAGSAVGMEVTEEHGGGSVLPASIFRAYDIRGIVGDTLTSDGVYELGRAIGSQAYETGQQAVIVARDARPSSGELRDSVIAGINAAGRDVVDLGMVPVPVLYFATHFLGSNAGVMVTGSHNTAEYNGLKIVMGGESLSSDAIQALRVRIEEGNLLQGSGSVREQDLLSDYIERIADDISVARTLRVVLDCGNGSAALVAPQLYRTLGCEVVELFCDVAGGPAGHHADPSRPENLEALQQAVVREQADLGLAFDGDGDRLGVVDSKGDIIWPDRLLMLLAADVLARHPGGDVLFDVKCSRTLASQILQNGGRPVMWKSGHSLLKAKLKETGALLAGEWSGHIMFRERWYGFDDAMYSGARLLEILSLEPEASAEVFAAFPQLVSTPELLLTVKEGRQHEVMDRLQGREDLLQGAKITSVDGLRAEFEEGWGLIRASNTAPALSFRFEADSEQALERIQARYRAMLAEVAPDLNPPF